MKRIFILILYLLSIKAFTQINHVIVNGKSNINTFKCINENFNSESNNYSFKKNQLPFLQLEVTHFDCKNKLMNSDLKKTLKADKFPKMFVKFLTFKKVNEQQYDANIEVKLANKTKNFTTSFLIVKNTLVGNEVVRFSDFGLKAPTKMGGLIVVEDQLKLTLTLKNY